MNCAWGYTWHGQYFYHSWLFWLLIVFVVAGLAYFFCRLGKNQRKKCPGCNSSVQDAYLRCPECGRSLKGHCPACNRIVENSWQFCPHCKEKLTPDIVQHAS